MNYGSIRVSNSSQIGHSFASFLAMKESISLITCSEFLSPPQDRFQYLQGQGISHRLRTNSQLTPQIGIAPTADLMEIARPIAATYSYLEFLTA